MHPLGLTAEDAQVMVAKVADHDPASASLEVKAWYRVTLAGREVEARGEGVLRGTKDEFICELDCTLGENKKVVRTRAWRDRAPRDLV